MNDFQNLNLQLSKLSEEKEVIGRLIYDYKLMAECYGLLQTEDFYDPKTSEIYSFLSVLYESGSDWSLVTLKSTFANYKECYDIFHYQTETFTTREFLTLVEVIKMSSIKRKILHFNQNQFESLHKAEPSQVTTDSLSFYSSVESGLQKKYKKDLTSLTEIHRELMEQRAKGLMTGITTGFKDLDFLLGQGMQRRDLIVIGARPSVGKTSFTLSLAHNAARKGQHVLFLSLEMDDTEIMDRLISFETGIPVTAMIRGTADKMRLEAGYKKLTELPLSILYTPSATSSEVYSLASKHKHVKGLDLLVVDYLGRLSDAGDDEVLRLGRISSNLKTTANMLDCALVIPHQLSRKIEGRSEEKRSMPMLSDLRDSGHIEQDADVVIFLNRDILGEKSDKAILRIGKNRTGETGILDVRFNTLTTKFEPLN